MKVIVAEKKDDEGFWLISCPKEEKRTPIYQCIGSFVKLTGTCSSVQNAVVSEDGARVTCLWPEKRSG